MLNSEVRLSVSACAFAGIFKGHGPSLDCCTPISSKIISGLEWGLNPHTHISGMMLKSRDFFCAKNLRTCMHASATAYDDLMSWA